MTNRNKVKQWKEGEVTGEEALVQTLTDALEIAATMLKDNNQKYWYRLQHSDGGVWTNVNIAPLILLTKEEAHRFNLCFDAYRFYNPMADA